MAKVKLLSPELISKIAAGEVIERPASAVKELIENALDAGTGSLEISLSQAGKSLIAIKDQGEGISRKDLELIFQRHTTSKISSLSDLYAINSLGFRGEALYSIAAVSDITLRSKTAQAETGWEIHLRGGKTLDLKPLNMPEGTEIEIKELFFNTPGRKKFLKSNSTELQHILNRTIPYALLNYACSFKLRHGSRTLIDADPAPDLAARTAGILKIRKQHLICAEKNFNRIDLSLKAVLGDINIQRTKKDCQFIFVNNRPVQNKAISFHLNRAYRALMPAGSNPLFCLYLSLPPSDIDVNIHPAKREIKLKDEKNICLLLHDFCRETILNSSSARQAKHSPYLRPGPLHLPDSDPEINEIKDQPVFQYKLHNPQLRSNDQSGPEPRPAAHTLKEKLAAALYIGPFLKKFLLFESGTSLLIIDQHAAQERITFEKLKNQIENSSLEIQNMISPLLIQLSPKERLIWEQASEKLEEIGFSTTDWDENSIALHAAPVLIKDPETALRGLLSAEKPVYEYDRDFLARRACRNSLKAGYTMIDQQAELIKKNLLSCRSPFTCPHGRPTVIEITEYTLDREFFRK